MKLISLNTWYGRAGKEELIDFFHRYEDIDVFCLQEMRQGGPKESQWATNIHTSLIDDISKVLPDHVPFFRPHYMDWYGLAIYAKKDLDIQEEGDIFVFKERENAFDVPDENHARNLQYMSIATPNGSRTIANFHGLWNGISKEDTDERMIQSDNIVRFLGSASNPYILCGDFNLLPENQSLKNLENAGMHNLIKEFKVTSTRSSHYKKPVRFADYTLVSDGIKVNEFKMLPDEISDHLAMYLDFE